MAQERSYLDLPPGFVPDQPQDTSVPDGFVLDKAAPEYGVGKFVKDVGRALYDVPTHALAAGAGAIEGTEPYTTENVLDDLRAESEKRAAERAALPEANDPAIFGLTRGQIMTDLPRSLGFSAVGAAGGLAGAVAGSPAGPAGSWTGGAVGATAAMQRSSANDFLRTAVEAANEENKAQTGKALTHQQKIDLQTNLNDLANKYGWWEAIPETVGMVGGLKIISAPIQGFLGKNVLGRIVRKAGELYGLELAQEIPTQIGQTNIQREAGLSPNEAERSFTSPSDIWKSTKEVAGQVALQTAIMGGLGAGGVRAYKALKNASAPQESVPTDDTTEEQPQESGSSTQPADTGQSQEIPAASQAVPESEGSTTENFDEEAHQAATSPLNDLTEPTDGQKEAGNFPMGHVKFQGLDISIENPKGSVRSGENKDGTPWKTEMQQHYGRIKGTIGNDDEHVDTFIGDSHDSRKVFVVDQIHPDTGKFDEHKVMLGFDSLEDADKAYHSNYEQGWKGAKTITEATMGQFKDWLNNGDTKKEFAPWKADQDVKDAARLKKANDARLKLQERNRLNPESDDLLAAIAKSGGLSMEEAKAQGIDPAHFNQRGHGIMRIFTKKGHSFDRMAELLHEHAYPVVDENGNYDANVLLDSLQNALHGDKVVSQHGLDALAEKMAAEHEDDHQQQETLPEDELEDRFAKEEKDQKTLQEEEDAFFGGGFSEQQDDVAGLLDEHENPPEHSHELADAISRYEALFGKGSADDVLEDASRQTAHLSEEEYHNHVISALEAAITDEQAKHQNDASTGTGKASSEGSAAQGGSPTQEEGEGLQLTQQVTTSGKQPRTPAKSGDLFGGKSETAQAVVDADEARKKKAENAPPVGQGEGDLFSGKSKQTDITDQTKKPKKIPAAKKKDIKALFDQDRGAHMELVEFDAYANGFRDAEAGKEEDGERHGYGKNGWDRIMGAYSDGYTRGREHVGGTRTVETATGDRRTEARPESTERRKDTTARKRVAEMTDEEKNRALLVDDLTGLWNRRAYEQEHDRKSIQVHIDLDALKWVNDNMGHESGDKMLRAFGEALAVLTDHGYHISGDEFVVQADTEKQARDIMARLEGALDSKTVTVTHPDGSTVTKKGIGYSYGIGRTGNQAEQRLQEHKAGREAQGLRSARGGEPSGVARTPAEGEQDNGRGVAPEFGASNKLFTKSAADEARALLKAKLGQLNAGFDPEIMTAGVKLAGYYVEGGIRTFAAFSKQMIDDLGEGIKPYLAYIYKAVRDYPGFDNAGMAADNEIAAEVEKLTAPQEETNDELRAQPSEPADRGGNQEDVAPSRSDNRPVDAGLAQGDQGNGEAGNTATGTEGAGRQGKRRTVKGESGRGAVTSGPARDNGAVRPESRPAGPVETKPHDFAITPDDQIGAGGAKTKYRNNVAAIRLIKQLDEEGRNATRDEQKVLAKYVGWGGIKGVFDPDNEQWSAEHKELQDLLTEDEYEAARRSMLDAHYTSTDVVRGMWGMLQRFGFEQGRIIEPSIGVGNFIGMAPRQTLSRSSVFGVELDRITGAIAKQLYQTATIETPTGYQDVSIPSDYFDVAIGNPPFGSQQLYDKNHPELSKMSIHNFFFAKTIDKLRPGGIMTMVVSRYFLDSTDTAAREYIAKRARLVGAIRLPNTAFKANAGTEVVTDIVILQKLKEGEVADTSWVHTSPKKMGEDEFNVNDYYKDHPDMILGTEAATGSMYAKNEYTVEPSGEISAGLEKALDSLPKDIYEHPEKRVELMTDVNGIVPDKSKVGAYFITKDGELARRLPDALGQRQFEKIEIAAKTTRERIDGMIGVRDALRDLMRAELSSDTTDAEMTRMRKRLNKLYDAFRNKYGFINGQANRRAFRDDPDMPLLESLEPKYDPGVSKAVAKKHGLVQRDPSAEKATIFNKRVLAPYTPITHTDNAKDALAASLSDRGFVDMEHMAKLTGKEEYEIRDELRGLIYRDPETEAYQTADEYLSGNVKAKLALAQEKAKENPDYAENVEALKSVQPPDLQAHDISVRLGSTWVPAKHVKQFAEELLGGSATVRFMPAVGKWSFDSTAGGTANTVQWGTQRYPATRLIDAILSLKQIIVRDNLGTSREPHMVVNEQETQAAQAKAEELSNKFKQWVWQDMDRRTELEKIYNDTFNTNRNRKYDGSHLTLPGISPAVHLRQNQRDAIWRAIQERSVLFDHVVGAGKTWAMAGAAMEMRRLGIARKPIFVVPNHLTLQWRDAFYQLYPNANVLAALKEDFTKSNRKRLFAKIATGDWDAVIVGHSSFERIGMPEQEQGEVLGEMLKDITDAIEEMKRERGDRNVIKDMERIKEGLDGKLKKLNDKAAAKDDIVTLDEIGADAIFVDESHKYKNLFFYSQMKGVDGLGNPQGSGRAFDMFVKTRYIQKRLGNRGTIVHATGTPVSNSLVEMFTVQRYMAYDDLKARGIHLLDSWGRVFGDAKQVYEVDPSGTGYRVRTRFDFQNMPELMTLYRGFADIISTDDLKAQAAAEGKRFPIPKMKGGRPILVVAPRSRQQQMFFGVPEFQRDGDGKIRFEYTPDALSVVKGSDLKGGTSEEFADKFFVIDKHGKPVSEGFDTQQEADDDRNVRLSVPLTKYNEGSILWKLENLRELNKESKGKINALSITNEARKAGLDYRLIDENAPDDPGSKINQAVDNIVRVYHEWEKDKGTQLVFCDLSVPASARGKVAKKMTAKEAEELSELADIDVPEEGEEGAVNMDQILASGGETGAPKSKHSVYDDMKAKLIAQGIPENQIAFIHDYDTDAKKAKLFKAINDGRIRVVFGSTEKMGAGTNVQERLVGIHHIDAPWKPSDLEQRNGRILRQGNKLYERDPDGFEVQQYRYATAQTYDTRMWQIIEHKANGIEKIRSEGVLDRTMGDIMGEAASAADMKAAASGNPLILEEIKLRNDAKALEAQQQGHDKNIWSMQGTKKRLLDAETRKEKDIQNIRDMIAVRDQNSPEEFSIKVGDTTYSEKKDAAEPIIRKMLEAKAGGNMVKAGIYRGFTFGFRFNMVGNHITAYIGKDGDYQAIATYTEKDKFSATGLIQRMDNTLKGFEESIDRINAQSERNKAELATIDEEMQKPFPKEEELADTRKRHRSILNKLRAQGGGIELTPEMRTELNDAIVARGGKPLADQIREEGVYYGYERETGSVQEPRKGRAAAVKSRNLDLFSTATLSNEPRARREQIVSNSAVRVILAPTGSVAVGISKVNNIGDAAHVIASFRKQPHENMLALVLDENRKPLTVIRAHIGTKDAATIDMATYAGAIASVPEARYFYMAHNHPSGVPDSSAADRTLTRAVVEIMQGTGIEFQGHAILSTGQKVQHLMENGREYTTTPTLAARTKMHVPVVERVMRKNTMFGRSEITSPVAMMDLSRRLEGNGVILFDNRHKFIGYLPFSKDEMSQMRGDHKSPLRRLLAALHETNAAATAIRMDVDDVEARNNINAALRDARVRVLDAIVHDGTQVMSVERDHPGGLQPAGMFFSDAATYNQTAPDTNTVKEESPEYDIGEVTTAAGEAREPARRSLRENMRRIVAALDAKLDPLTSLKQYDRFATMRNLTQGKIAHYQEVAKHVNEVLNKATAEDAMAVYDYLTTPDATTADIADQKIAHMAEDVKNEIDTIGQMLVERGMIPEESYEKYQGAYLPRVYFAYLIGDNAILSSGRGKMMSDRGYTKARKDIPKEVRDIFLGEIKNAAYLASRALSIPTRDMALLDWLDEIATNPNWVLPRQFVKWNVLGDENGPKRRVTPYWLKRQAENLRKRAPYYEDEASKEEAMRLADRMDAAANAKLEAAGLEGEGVPEGYKQMPNSTRFGALRGMVVRAPIYDDIVGVADMVRGERTLPERILGYGGAGTKITQWWKWSKVAANPPAQVRNFLSNMILLQLSGVPMHRIPTLLVRAVRDYASKGQYYQIARRHGVSVSTFAANEMARIERDVVNLEMKTRGDGIMPRLKLLIGALQDKTGDLYQFSETLGKTMKIMHEMEYRGADENAAVIDANKWLFDYSEIPQWARYLRNAPIGAPFLTFQLKVLPRLLEVMLTAPWRFAPYAALLSAMPLLLASMYDVDKDDIEALKKALPEWLQRRGHAMLIPSRDEYGRWRAIDLGYFFPWTAYTQFGKDVAGGQFSDALQDTGLFGGPLPDLITALKTNKDPFTGKDIVDPSDPPSRQFAAIMTYIYGIGAPPWLVGLPFAGVDPTYKGAIGHLYDALTGHVDKYGEPRNTPLQAAARFGGVNIYPVEPERTRSDNIRHRRFEIQDIKSRMNRLIKDRNLTAEQRRAIVEEYQARILEKQRDLQQYARESRVHPNLR